MNIQAYFDAQSVYQDLCVNLQYKDLFHKSNEEVLIEFVNKYGMEKITEAVRVLCKDLDEKRKRYLEMLNIAHRIKLMEGKKNG
jgi:hypothetical protein